MIDSLKLWKFTFFLAVIASMIIFSASFVEDQNVYASLIHAFTVLISVAVVFGFIILLWRAGHNLPKLTQYSAIGFMMCIIVPTCASGVGYYINMSR